MSPQGATAVKIVVFATAGAVILGVGAAAVSGWLVDQGDRDLMQELRVGVPNNQPGDLSGR